MRKSVLWNLSHVRVALALLFALAGSLTINGCGGGGGGSSTTTTTGSTGDPTKATVTGIVRDTTTTAAPIVGATVSIAGTSLSAKTGADGKFSIINAPVGSVSLIVTSPDPTVYYGTVLYNTKLYNDPAKCPIAVTTHASSAGTSNAGTLQLYPAGTNPPAPPYTGTVDANGCPK